MYFTLYYKVLFAMYKTQPGTQQLCSGAGERWERPCLQEPDPGLLRAGCQEVGGHGQAELLPAVQVGQK